MKVAVTTGEVSLGGFVTLQLHLQGQTLEEIERRLGFDSGRLSLGAWFATPTRLPGPDDFQFAGYSQVAGHYTKARYGNINDPDTGWEKQAYVLRKKNVIAGWQLYGINRLIKVVPMIGHSPNLSNDYQYPPGNGIPQWKIVRPIMFRGIGYVGNYPKGRFIPDQGYTEVKYQ
jgi:hypothetical protein